MAALGASALLFAVFVSLGTWQVQRRSWKLDLITRVEQRAHAPAIEAPGPERWPLITNTSDEYRHVRVTGQFLHEQETLVRAATELGSGFWVLTPLRQPDGTVVLVNRGFVPPALRERSARAAGEPQGTTTVTGLLRTTEPMTGLMGWLSRNDPGTNRWYWRDVQGIAAARSLGITAPYFIDADAPPANPSAGPLHREPVAGLTVIVFRNHHLVYAITWYALALMVVGGGWLLLRDKREAI